MRKPPPAVSPESAKALFAIAPFRLFWAARFCDLLAVQVQAVTMAWQVYAMARLTRSVPEAALMVGHDRPGPVPAAVRADPERRRGGRPQRPAPDHAGLRRASRCCAASALAAYAYGPAGRLVADLRARRRVRRRARLLRPRLDGPGADAGAARPAAARHRLELAGLAERRDPRARRSAACCAPRSPALAYSAASALYLVSLRPAAADPQDANTRPERRPARAGADQGGPGLRLAQQDRVRRHLARPVRGAAGRGDGAAAGVRPRRAARRRRGLRHPARRRRRSARPLVAVFLAASPIRRRAGL